MTEEKLTSTFSPAWRRWAGAALALVVLLLVFALYGNPDFMVMLADQMWACF